jgi:WD40 repeat protein
VFDIPTGTVPNGMPFSPDGRYLAVCGEFWVTVIDTLNKANPTRTIKFDDWVKSCTISPDGSTLACAETTGLTHFLSLETLQPVREPFVTDTELPDDIQYIPGTNHLAVVGLENRLRIWDVTTASIISESERYPTFFATVRVSPDGQRIGVGSIDGKFRIFRAEDCAELMSFEIPNSYPYADFSPDGQSLVVSAGDQPFVAHGSGQDELKRLSIAALLEAAQCQGVSNIRKLKERSDD